MSKNNHYWHNQSYGRGGSRGRYANTGNFYSSRGHRTWMEDSYPQYSQRSHTNQSNHHMQGSYHHHHHHHHQQQPQQQQQQQRQHQQQQQQQQQQHPLQQQHQQHPQTTQQPHYGGFNAYDAAYSGGQASFSQSQQQPFHLQRLPPPLPPPPPPPPDEAEDHSSIQEASDRLKALLHLPGASAQPLPPVVDVPQEAAGGASDSGGERLAEKKGSKKNLLGQEEEEPWEDAKFLESLREMPKAQLYRLINHPSSRDSVALLKLSQQIQRSSLGSVDPLTTEFNRNVDCLASMSDALVNLQIFPKEVVDSLSRIAGCELKTELMAKQGLVTDFAVDPEEMFKKAEEMLNILPVVEEFSVKQAPLSHPYEPKVVCEKNDEPSMEICSLKGITDPQYDFDFNKFDDEDLLADTDSSKATGDFTITTEDIIESGAFLDSFVLEKTKSFLPKQEYTEENCPSSSSFCLEPPAEPFVEASREFPVQGVYPIQRTRSNSEEARKQREDNARIISEREGLEIEKRERARREREQRVQRETEEWERRGRLLKEKEEKIARDKKKQKVLAAQKREMHKIQAMREKAQREKDERIRKEREEKAKKEREEKAQKEKEEKARWEREDRVQREREREERVQREREERAQREREGRVQREREERAQRERAQRERDERAQKEREERIQKEREERVQGEREEKAQREREEKAQREREEKAQRERGERAQREREERAQREREERAQREREERAQTEREERAQREREERAQREREERTQREREERTQREREERTQREREERAQRQRVIKEREKRIRRERELSERERNEKNHRKSLSPSVDLSKSEKCESRKLNLMSVSSAVASSLDESNIKADVCDETNAKRDTGRVPEGTEENREVSQADEIPASKQEEQENEVQKEMSIGAPDSIDKITVLRDVQISLPNELQTPNEAQGRPTENLEQLIENHGKPAEKHKQVIENQENSSEIQGKSVGNNSINTEVKPPGVNKNLEKTEETPKIENAVETEEIVVQPEIKMRPQEDPLVDVKSSENSKVSAAFSNNEEKKTHEENKSKKEDSTKNPSKSSKKTEKYKKAEPKKNPRKEKETQNDNKKKTSSQKLQKEPKVDEVKKLAVASTKEKKDKVGNDTKSRSRKTHSSSKKDGAKTPPRPIKEDLEPPKEETSPNRPWKSPGEKKFAADLSQNHPKPSQPTKHQQTQTQSASPKQTFGIQTETPSSIETASQTEVSCDSTLLKKIFDIDQAILKLIHEKNELYSKYGLPETKKRHRKHQQEVVPPPAITDRTPTPPPRPPPQSKKLKVTLEHENVKSKTRKAPVNAAVEVMGRKRTRCRQLSNTSTSPEPPEIRKRRSSALQEAGETRKKTRMTNKRKAHPLAILVASSDEDTGGESHFSCSIRLDEKPSKTMVSGGQRPDFSWKELIQDCFVVVQPFDQPKKDDLALRAESAKTTAEVTTSSVVSTNLTMETNSSCTGPGIPILCLKVHDNCIMAAAEDGKLYEYDMSTCCLERTIECHSKAITCMLFVARPEKKSMFCSGSLDSMFHVYSVHNWDKVHAVDAVNAIQCMDTSWDNVFFGTVGGDLYICQLDQASAGEFKCDHVKVSDTPVLAIKATKEGCRKVLVVSTRNQDVTVRDAATGLLLRNIINGGSGFTVFSLLLQESKVVCGTSGSDLLIYDFISGDQLSTIRIGNGAVCLLQFRCLLFAGCYDGNIYVLNLKTCDVVATVKGPGGFILSIDLFDSKLIVSSKNCNELKIWKIPRDIMEHTFW